MNAKLSIDDCHRVGSHLAGADRVVGGFCRALADRSGGPADAVTRPLQSQSHPTTPLTAPALARPTANQGN